METVTKADQELDAIKEHVEALRAELAGLTRARQRLEQCRARESPERRPSRSRSSAPTSSAPLMRCAGKVRRPSRRSRILIKERPLLSLLAAFGAGVLIARLLGRSVQRDPPRCSCVR